MSHHYTRKVLERKDELRLYEWLKDNYSELQGKTVSEGAQVIKGELDLDISPNTVVSMVKDMNIEPFWRARVRQHQANGQEGELEQRLSQLAQVCENLVARVERLELEHSLLSKEMRVG